MTYVFSLREGVALITCDEVGTGHNPRMSPSLSWGSWGRGKGFREWWLLNIWEPQPYRSSEQLSTFPSVLWLPPQGIFMSQMPPLGNWSISA